MEKEALELVKLQADENRECTISKMLEKDEDYQNALEQLRILEPLFEQLDLSKSQRAIIDAYIQVWDGIHVEFSTYAYLAGIHDALANTHHIGFSLPN